ncbi:hypothetical protein [Paraburkholderia acidipaludis]|uniref:hypothetical protein n=1 Tax=Paraburkholderia acidipaludis TaxID=660537 RepID=UPI00048801E7|nr:hypothetical protein [Paraburkholderia acidipaludis]
MIVNSLTSTPDEAHDLLRTLFAAGFVDLARHFITSPVELDDFDYNAEIAKCIVDLEPSDGTCKELVGCISTMARLTIDGMLCYGAPLNEIKVVYRAVNIAYCALAIAAGEMRFSVRH